MLTSALNIPDFDADALLKIPDSLPFTLGLRDAPGGQQTLSSQGECTFTEASPNQKPWTPEEDVAIVEAHARLGSKWAEIALVEALRGRSSKAIQVLDSFDWIVFSYSCLILFPLSLDSWHGTNATNKRIQGR